ncbi:putative XRN 5' 3' exonuclease N terminus [Trypanosoma vivax]|uniref:5'-3' exonuclease, putative n=1 Tax=Trypanosoma vivax (strain Y486) TaxID=1055687 RepID=F9WKE4_TRYVY|nr:putative XRN 5' 3' exonuclease N terminus [Trypanosoma vivax]CCD17964.1 5'-3' exonuclease, putative [Trypanosoma vivax Y486]|eukprot:CCD17964.1 5'-3' exonuclease, putative [Trypanosoma vivax Y486]
MGVPKFASWLRNKYPDVVSNNCPTSVHGLYVDLNGLIHPCCHSENDPSIALLPEGEKLECICYEVELLVETVRPQEVLYIAVDGVAPRAKMNQQRARRYMSRAVPARADKSPSRASHAKNNRCADVVEEVVREFTSDEIAEANNDLNEVRNLLLQDSLYGQPVPDASVGGNTTVFVPRSDTSTADISAVEFDSNCISPGTAFMSKVADKVLAMLQRNMTSDDSKWSRLCVIFSDSRTPGEGEQKIIDFLRTQSSYPGFNGRGSHVIVGLDADLIFLALSLHIPGVTILRDTTRNPHKRRAAAQQQRGPRSGKQKKYHFPDDARVMALNRDSSDDDTGDEVFGVPVETSSDDVDFQAPKFTPHTVAARDPKYEYFDVDVIGNSLVSEVRALCEIKGFEPADESAFCPESLVSPSGYYFCRSLGKGVNAAGPSTSSSAEGKPASTRRKQRELMGNWRDFKPFSSFANSKVIDDIILIAMLMGNDFIPHLPSAFCGESALDNFLELYVTDVLPYGFLTIDSYEISLPQLRRLLESYAKIEAVLFRRHKLLADADQNVRREEAGTGTGVSDGDLMTVSRAAEPLNSSVDVGWRNAYLSTTGLSERVHEACEAYVNGLRFVWRYYTSSSGTCWSWYYPFHHGPLALDMAAYLQSCDVGRLPPVSNPATEPPNTLLQMLCVFPPTSHALLPAILGSAMLEKYKSQQLSSSFPKSWSVDYHDSNEKHLAIAMIPFADVRELQPLVDAAEPHLTEEERWHLRQLDFHLVIRTSRSLFKPNGNIVELSHDGSASALSQFVRIAIYDNVMFSQLRETLPARSRPRTYSSTVAIPSITGDGFSSGGGSARSCRKRRADTCHADKERRANNDTKLAHYGPSFAVFLLHMFAASIATVLAVRPASFLMSFQIAAIGMCAVITAFVLGIAVQDPLAGSVIRRNKTRLAYADWLCTECLSLNFAVRNKCFVCRAPFNTRRCLAVYSGKGREPKHLYDADHAAYMETVALPW